MGQALYRKHRPKGLSEVVGQEHITTALQNALKKGQISHAYLFTGPRGVGKTSIARILAHAVNDLPYDEDATHLDIIEIDAASNRRIDEIRELRERVHNAPANAKYKVYIIDEVHMLTREAFNALLKTLEEPPAHAIFILATTEAHKLPDTIVSRTQRYNFRPIDPQKVTQHLRSIASAEKIKVDDDALELIAAHGEGAFRDSISLLDQVRNITDHVKLADVQRTLGIAPGEAILQLIEALQTNSPGPVLEQLHAMELQGFHAPMIAKQLAGQLRSQLLQGNLALPHEMAAKLLRNLLDVPSAPDSTRLLEIILLEATLSEGNKQGMADNSKAKGSDEQPPKETGKKEKPAKNKPKVPDGANDTEETNIHKQEKPVANHSAQAPNQAESLNEQLWQNVLAAIKARHNTLYSVTRMAVPSFNGDELTLAFSFPFHQKRLEEAKNRQIISDIIEQTTGQSVTIKCIVDINARTKPAAVTAPTTQNPVVETISNIFGGGEMLE
jgi:DNA polymerase III subunit gamma/tau